MKSLNATVLAEKAKQNLTAFYLVNIGDAYFFTDCPNGLTYDGDSYNYWPVKLKGFRSSDGSTLDGGEVEIGNVEREMSSIVLNNLMKDMIVYIYEAFYAKDSMTLLGVDIMCAGKVDGRPALTEEWASITVAPHINPWNKRFPPRMISKKNFPYIIKPGTVLTWGTKTMPIEPKPIKRIPDGKYGVI